MSLLRPRGVVRDDAGRPCEVVPVAELHADERRVDEAFASVVDRCGRAWIAAASSKTVLAVAAIVPGVGLVLHVIINPNVPFWFAMLLWMVPLAIFGGWRARRNRGRVAQRVADILLADGLCPGCLYNLAALPEEDGLVRCPECGGGWSASRIVRRHEFVVRAETEIERQKRWWRSIGGIDAWGPTRITDDRDQTRPIVSGRLRQQIRAATGERRERLLAARREIGREQRVGRWLVAGFFGLVYAAVSVSVLKSGVAAGSPALSALLGLFMLWVTVFMPMMIVRGNLGFTTPRVREAMLRHSMCPSCGFDLNAARGADGLVECGECGAGWRDAACARETQR
ncbi:MAG: hypothetical protein ACF8LK_02150 [Phycisphaerales bacterium JB041]